MLVRRLAACYPQPVHRVVGRCVATPVTAPAPLPPPSLLTPSWRSLASSTTASPDGPSAPAPAGASGAPRRKYKSSFKRASSEMQQVKAQAEAVMAERLAKHRPQLAEFDIGDAVELKYTTEVSETRAVAVRGTVIARRRKGIDSSFTILNAIEDDLYVARYPLSSPLLKEIKVLQKWRATDGRKRPRRAKLYYLMDRLPKEYKVTANTKDKTNSAWLAKQQRKAAAQAQSDAAHTKPRTRL